MTLHKAGSSPGFNIALKREGEKERKKELLQHRVFIFAPIQVLTPPNRA